MYKIKTLALSLLAVVLLISCASRKETSQEIATKVETEDSGKLFNSRLNSNLENLSNFKFTKWDFEYPTSAKSDSGQKEKTPRPTSKTEGEFNSSTKQSTTLDQTYQDYFKKIIEDNFYQEQYREVKRSAYALAIGAFLTGFVFAGLLSFIISLVKYNRRLKAATEAAI